MSIYKKLSDARQEFHVLDLKKTGWNDYSKYSYFELADFLEPALKVFRDAGLIYYVSFGELIATMTIVDIESSEKIEITSPMGSAKLKACHEVQNIGAVETYQRRYLLLAALEIVEHDAVDSSEGAVKPKKGSPQKDKPAEPDKPWFNDFDSMADSMADKIRSGERTAAQIIDNLAGSFKLSKDTRAKIELLGSK